MSVHSVTTRIIGAALIATLIGSTLPVNAKSIDRYNCHDLQTQVFEPERSCSEETKRKKKRTTPSVAEVEEKKDWKTDILDGILNSGGDGGGGDGGNGR